ncbi:MAG: tetratricopeptide repeat protein, partial [Spirochaetes bacterium]|nr:tetratricopeptide repeat protein [Spirochaetota bacterium]
ENYYKTAITKKNISRQYLINSYWNALIMAEQRNDYESVVSICRSMWERTGDAAARQKIESLINKLLWTDNNDAIEKYNEGVELKKSGKNADAMNRFKSAVNIESSFLAPKFELGMNAYKNGDLDRASDYLGDIASRIPFYAEVQMVMGDIQLERHNYRSAVAHYDRVFEFGFIDNAADYRIRIRRGTCHYNLDDLPSAEDDIEKALAINPKSVEASLLMSAIKIKMEKYDDALKTLKRAASSNPDNPEIQYQIGSVYYRRNDQRHISHFEKLFSLAGNRKDYPSKYRKVFILLATHDFQNGNYRRCVTILNTFDETARTFDTRLMTARAYFHLKEYDNAIDHFEKLSLANDDRFMLCRAYALSGRREKAKSILSELSGFGDYLSRARKDPALSGMAKDLGDPTDQPVIEKSEPEKKDAALTEPVKEEAVQKKQNELKVKKKPSFDDEEDDSEDEDNGADDNNDEDADDE